MSTKMEEIEEESTDRRSHGLELLRNLDTLTRKMKADELADVREEAGHRQFPLARRGQLTITLFHFEEGSELPQHQANGLTTLHVLDGQFVVETDQSQRILTRNDFFVLEPKLEHSVCAYEESRAILTIEHTGQ